MWIMGALTGQAVLLILPRGDLFIQPELLVSTRASDINQGSNSIRRASQSQLFLVWKDETL